MPMFHNSYTFTTVAEAQLLFQKMVPEVRKLFPAVEVLIRLLLICAVSSCAAERSFSALRRLKNWLRSTMTQQRLNAVSVCHVNKDILDRLDLTELAVDFARRSTIRENIFGHFSLLKFNTDAVLALLAVLCWYSVGLLRHCSIMDYAKPP